MVAEFINTVAEETNYFVETYIRYSKKDENNSN